MCIESGVVGSPSSIKKPSLLLMASNTPFQYRVLRCAAQAGASVFILGSGRAKFLAWSRYCKDFVLYPRDFGEENSSELVDIINSLSSILDIDYVIPGCGDTTRLLGQIRDRLHSKCFPVPPPSVFDTLNDKGKFVDLCLDLGMPHPSSVLLADPAELRSMYDSGQLHFPLIAKPVDGYGSEGVVKLEGLSADMDLGKIDYSPILLQEFVEGEDVCISLFCVEGVCKHQVVYKRKRGICFIEHDFLSELAQTVARHLNFDGVICFDARLAVNGKRVYLIECNPRFWYNMDFAMVAGVNFVGLGIDQAGNECPVAAMKTFSSPYSFLLKVFTPWQMNAQDVAMLRYWLADPIPFLWIEIGLNLPGLIVGKAKRAARKIKGCLGLLWRWRHGHKITSTRE
ncbi:MULTISPECIES: ATP-grasp domain-containing protein [Methylococcus]|uniref:ATP-grasp domain-containing protein n=1 Tax=Methylococcus capsulatus TaxID=414 RepID=A0ABZ2F7K2_METCP|nr:MULTISPECIES: ATP-grasp domain-containing protein [Methylococcus]MDF9392761.1 ATP-grasp domain-containing protein [Methylococcus capsulatus]